MVSKAEKIYVFEEFRLEPDKRALHRVNGSDEQIRLSNRPFQVLLYLLENRERFVGREELLEKFWDGREVYDTALTKAVGAVRKALNEPPENPRFIETRWAEGYRFIGNVEEQPVYLEIERTRKVRLVIEEDSEPAATDDFPQAVSRNNLKVSNLKLQTARARFFTRGRTVAAVCGILALILLFYTLIRPPASALQTKPASFNSIAVLPLKNLSGIADRDIFVDGMTESLISSFSKIKGLKVISRNSSAAFKDKAAPPHEIAERLGVTTYLEGNYRESGDKIRVDVRLVNAEDGEILWDDNYEKSLGDVFAIQDEIARSVTTKLRLKLSSAEEQQIVKRQTSNIEAYQNYVKGRYFWKKKTPEDLETARRFFEKAIALDPDYALAYAGIASYYSTGIWYADFPPAEATKNAQAMAAKVFEIDAQSPEAHNLRAKLAELEWDWETCRHEYEKAIELN
ncbi:MAG TPA: winged helix-turn-helix domain-containing protein, partial [Pyrinomonadaceae bacterium]|nr:winged helix-turn-helix domain-containing protein [Pyrinomonadaceae bacterium]